MREGYRCRPGRGDAFVGHLFAAAGAVAVLPGIRRPAPFISTACGWLIKRVSSRRLPCRRTRPIWRSGRRAICSLWQAIRSTSPSRRSDLDASVQHGHLSGMAAAPPPYPLPARRLPRSRERGRGGEGNSEGAGGGGSPPPAPSEKTSLPLGHGQERRNWRNPGGGLPAPAGRRPQGGGPNGGRGGGSEGSFFDSAPPRGYNRLVTLSEGGHP